MVAEAEIVCQHNIRVLDVPYRCVSKGINNLHDSDVAIDFEVVS